ncbi:MAG TPA: hypothetical protein VFS08_09670 [Gemmatimonadaceae bacterium]|nr:hypothetical protein [Gemmatimonadaceae bacterium]
MATDTTPLRDFLTAMSEDAAVAQSFQQDPEGTMARYSLDDEARKLVRNGAEAALAIREYFNRERQTAAFFLFILIFFRRSGDVTTTGETSGQESA